MKRQQRIAFWLAFIFWTCYIFLALKPQLEPYKVPCIISLNVSKFSSYKERKHQALKLGYLPLKFYDLEKVYPPFEPKTIQDSSAENRSSNSYLLFYSAVPKTGTSLLETLWKILQERVHGFQLQGRRTMPMREGAHESHEKSVLKMAKHFGKIYYK